MDEVQKLLGEASAQAHLARGKSAVAQDLLKARGLQYGNLILLFKNSDLGDHFHPPAQNLKELTVMEVNLLS